MWHRAVWAIVCGGLLSAGCAGPSLEQRRDAALPAIEALRKGSFEEAGRRAGDAIGADGANAHARLVRAVVRYEEAAHQLALDGRSLVMGALGGSVNQKYLSATLGDAEADLAAVEADLAVAAKDPGLAVELCVACWEIDWNGDGEIDGRDRRLFEIERDADDHPIPEGDPRRRPTFRFDAGDVAWARAFVSFQRAALDVVLAYDLSDLARIDRKARGRAIVLRLVHPERIAAARERILEGLDRSDEARRAYLAETDDDREWVPSPRQKSHPLPLPVDQALYDTWEGVVGDVRRLVQGSEGLSVAEVADLAGERFHGAPPRGYLDVGGMLSRPRDIVLDVRGLEHVDEHDPEQAMRALVGDYYVRGMQPSPLPRRLLRMKGEIDHGKEELRHKLRYLFWLN